MKDPLDYISETLEVIQKYGEEYWLWCVMGIFIFCMYLVYMWIFK